MSDEIEMHFIQRPHSTRSRPSGFRKTTPQNAHVEPPSERMRASGAFELVARVEAGPIDEEARF
jgi:hypothetical protein